MNRNDENYNVVAMIGSMRFQEEHDNAVKAFFIQGDVPIPLIRLGLISQRVKRVADCHIRKVIDMADFVYVINKDGYVGKSTLSEIGYARKKNKPIQYLENPKLSSYGTDYKLMLVYKKPIVLHEGGLELYMGSAFARTQEEAFSKVAEINQWGIHYRKINKSHYYDNYELESVTKEDY